jgi:alpha-tubulin suppressor-like RCC1 family protein
MSRIDATTNFRDSNGVDLGKKLITKDYLISVYPEIGQKIGIPPELWIWGGGFRGALGNNANTDRSTPVTTLAGGSVWKQVISANEFTAAIKTDGTLWTWGFDGSGQLGTNTLSNRSTPVTTFAGGTNWKQVDGGSNHCAAIKTDGTLWVWGSQASGKLGNALVGTNNITPVTTFAGGTNWKQVSCGYHTAAIKTDGTLWTWGNNSTGALGNAVTTNVSTPVTTFAGGNNWKQVSAAIGGGGSYMAAIKTDGTLWTWGLGSSGQLGNNSGTSVSTPVTTFAGGNNWKQVSAGSGNIAAIKTDGTLWTWGSNTSTPVTTFAGGTNWKQVSCGSGHIAAIKTDGTLWTLGSGSNGRLGNNNEASRATPVTTFAGGTNWKQVDCGTTHTAAIKSVDF